LSSFLLLLLQVFLGLVLCAYSSPFSYYFYCLSPSSFYLHLLRFHDFIFLHLISFLVYYCFPYSRYSLFFHFVSLSLFTSLYFLFSPYILLYSFFKPSILFSTILFVVIFPFFIINFLFNSPFSPCSLSLFLSSPYSSVPRSESCMCLWQVTMNNPRFVLLRYTIYHHDVACRSVSVIFLPF
jgi:hypothetical protein